MASLVRRLTWSNQNRPRASAPSDASGGNVIKKGLLKKKGHMRRNWLNRYFVLSNDGLHYYKDEVGYSLNPGKPTGNVVLFGCTVKEDLFQRHENVFTIWTVDGRDYHMQAPSKEEMVQWVAAIDRISKVKLSERRKTEDMLGDDSAAEPKPLEKRSATSDALF